MLAFNTLVTKSGHKGLIMYAPTSFRKEAREKTMTRILFSFLFIATDSFMILLDNKNFMKIIGLDLAGVEKRPTGFCIMDGMNVKTFILYSDDEILHEVEHVKPEVIAIDAPLTLPKGRKSIEERTNIHLRECDRLLLKRGIKFFPITLGPMRLLTKRGIRLKKILKKKGFRVIEVYPGGAQDVLGIPRKQKGTEKLRKSLESLGIEGLKETMNDHELDAVTCAFVGKLFLEGRYEVLGSVDDGIVMPLINKR